MRVGCVSAIALLVASSVTAVAQDRVTAPQISFKVVENFLKLPPTIYMAEVVGVDVDSKGQIYVLHRGKQPILEFNPDGSFVRSIGEGLPFEGPHSVRIDPQDNLWYIDAGTNLIIKFDTQKRVQMVLGRRPEPWTWATDVTWGPDGTIFVADGYGKSRIAKFNKEGNLVKSWGERGTGPGDFNTPHSIVIDRQNNLYVADRQNGRIQVFDTEGTFKQEWHPGGNPWSLCMPRGGAQVLYVRSVGRVYKMDLGGKIIGTLGKFGRVPGMMDWVHAVSCPDEHTLYAAQELSFRLDK